ncbi:TetR family transcriptional regulator [Ligilactobacillus pobuzihii]|uniref:TetR/AcrR family transcriptional regulator n=1 Tax=Ligilactobacillus pobuzihii TaxID=449659 RepID=UPI0019D0AB58|nr:TetR/AcrR family transcriptional regulator [Ligilactobacillus pobuzihii]MBN7274025.1 TetR family transcriptional regulator [Ligilactobacillus pobuzihii]
MMTNQTIINVREDAKKDLTTKQAAVIDAAITLFSQKGFANTSTGEIAQQAKVSEGSIFRHFHNKEHLLLAILDPLTSKILPSELNAITNKMFHSEKLELLDFITMLIEDRSKFINLNLDVFKSFISEALYTPVVREKIFQAISQEDLNEFFKVIDNLKKNKRMVNWTNAEIISYIAANITGFILNYFVIFHQNWEDTEQARQNLIAFLVKGLTP